MVIMSLNGFLDQYLSFSILKKSDDTNLDVNKKVKPPELGVFMGVVLKICLEASLLPKGYRQFYPFISIFHFFMIFSHPLNLSSFQPYLLRKVHGLLQ